MKARPTKTTFRNLSEQNAKKLALILGAVLFLLIIAIALVPAASTARKRPMRSPPTRWAATCSRASTGKRRGWPPQPQPARYSLWKTRFPGAWRAATSKS